MAGLVDVVVRGIAQIVTPHCFTHIELSVPRSFLGGAPKQPPEMLPIGRSGASRSVTKPVDEGPIQGRRLLSDRRAVMLTPTNEGPVLTQGLLHHRVRAFGSVFCEGIGEEGLAGLASVLSGVEATYAAYGNSRMR